jgi:hypothetical protein
VHIQICPAKFPRNRGINLQEYNFICAAIVTSLSPSMSIMGEADSMERSPSSEANSCSADSKSSAFFRTWKIHYHLEKNTPLDSVGLFMPVPVSKLSFERFLDLHLTLRSC